MPDLIGAGHGPLRVWTLEERHRHPILDAARLPHTKIPAGTAVPYDHGRQFVHPPASGELPARLAGLTDLKPRGSDAEDVADAYRFFGEALDREILAETP